MCQKGSERRWGGRQMGGVGKRRLRRGKRESELCCGGRDGEESRDRSRRRAALVSTRGRGDWSARLGCECAALPSATETNWRRTGVHLLVVHGAHRESSRPRVNQTSTSSWTTRTKMCRDSSSRCFSPTLLQHDCILQVQRHTKQVRRHARPENLQTEGRRNHLEC